MEGGPRFTKPWHCPGAGPDSWGKCCVDGQGNCSPHSPNCKSAECSVASWQVWAKAMPDGGQAAIVINRSDKPLTGISVPLTALGLNVGVTARDIWSGKDLGKMNTQVRKRHSLSSQDFVGMLMQSDLCLLWLVDCSP